MTRIFLADDHPVIRQGLRSLIESKHPDWEVCGEARNCQEAVDLSVKLEPDVVVLDLNMPTRGASRSGLGAGLETLRQIRHLVPQVQILVFSMFDNEQTVREALASGANGYVAKGEDGMPVMAAIEALAQHQGYISSLVAPAVLDSWRANGSFGRTKPAPKKELTERQREVARLMAEGKTSREIAAALTISDKTAKTHRSAIMHRLGVKTVAEVVLYAVRVGLIALAL